MDTIRAITVVFLLFFVTAVFATDKIDINSADEATISAAMSGVGLQKASAIVAYRKQHGPFKSLEDLVKVKGIGINTVHKNQDRITVTSRNDAVSRH